jgi:hypothetical protein
MPGGRSKFGDELQTKEAVLRERATVAMSYRPLRSRSIYDPSG